MMKRMTSLAVLTLLLGSRLAFAGEGVMQGMVGQGMMNDEMMEHGMMMKEKMMGHGMMKGMCSPSMVASNDGGVIVLIGNKLSKYDKNLNLVKEVELKTDKGSGMCPMMMRKDKMMEEAPAPSENDAQQK